MEIIFLGTSAMVPTKERNHSGLLLNYRSEHILIDCGEGIQRQLKKIGYPLPNITKILISHLDGDHILGLMGLFQSLSGSEYKKTLEIYGPKGTNSFINGLFRLYGAKVNYEIKVKDVSGGKFIDSDDFYIEARGLKHTKPTLGYSFVEKDFRRVEKSKLKVLKLPNGPMIGKLASGKSVQHNGKTIKPDDVSSKVKGKKVTIIMDTMYHEDSVKLAKDADVVVCDSTYTSEFEKKALKYKHMTAGQAGTLAKKAKAKHLVLTHFSARYKNAKPLEKDAQKVFKNSRAAQDFMRIKL